MTSSPSVRAQIESSRTAIGALREQAEEIGHVAELCVQALREGKKILTCGNGGSATDAMHLAEELVARYRSNRRTLPALCLAAAASVLTCIANDLGWDDVFARQVEAHGRGGDVLVACTTSGTSENVNRALAKAREKGVKTVGFLGKGGGEARALCDHAIVVASEETPRIQEAHTLLLHILCEAVEAEFAV